MKTEIRERCSYVVMFSFVVFLFSLGLFLLISVKHPLAREKVTPFQADCRAMFAAEGCNNCHELSGKGEMRQNLSPKGLKYYRLERGCVAMHLTIMSQNLPKEERMPLERIQLAKQHYGEFGCLRCHSPQAKGKSEANLLPLGIAEHKSGMGCIQCLNAMKKSAGRTDMTPLPKLEF